MIWEQGKNGAEADSKVSAFEAAELWEEVDRLSRSSGFVESPRALEFLRFVVEESLAGRAEELSQRRIADQVYGRGEDFDPTQDPIVRMQAGRVRRTLDHYYLTEGRKSPIVISLPKGNYAPLIKRNGTPRPSQARSGSVSPVLLVIPFQNCSGMAEFEFIAQGFASDLAVALDRYQMARVMLLPADPLENEAVADQVQRACGEVSGFLVKGQIACRSGSLRVSVRLEEFSTGVLKWSRVESCEIESGERDRFLDDLVERVAASIAEEQGAVSQLEFDQIGSVPVHDANAYEALLHLYHAEYSGKPELYREAILALRHAVTVSPEDGRLWSGLARMCTLNHILEIFPDLQVPMTEAIGYAEKGVALRSQDQREWCILGFAQTMTGNLEQGRKATLTALAQNPDSMFFRDVIGYLLILQGDWERGAILCRKAVKLNPFVRGTAYAGLWLEAFRREDYEASYGWAERYLEHGIFWSPVMRIASLVRLGRQQEAEAIIEHLLLVRPDFAESGARLLRKGIKTEAVAAEVEDALRSAGVVFDKD